MAMSVRLKTFLETAKIPYTLGHHATAYTAQEIAAASHVPGRRLAKCVLVNTDRGALLAVLPATHVIDFKQFRTVLKTKTVSIANEAQIKERFPDIEVGAMSPFGQLYQIPVAVDQTLAAADELSCNAGSHTETITVGYRAFVNAVHPQEGLFAKPLHVPPAATSKKGRATPRAIRARAASTSKGRSAARRLARRAPSTARRASSSRNTRRR